MNTASDKEVAVFYLARAAEGSAAMLRFLKTYHDHAAGIPHQPVIILKGEFNTPELRQTRAEYRQAGFLEFQTADVGFDLDAYFNAAQQTQASQYFFMNTFTQILTTGWLAKLASPLADPHVGLVGTTGSWESHSSNWGWIGVNFWRRSWWHAAQYVRSFPRFPNCHIRTNGFGLPRETLLKLRIPALRSKFDAHRFESGYRGLTRQVLKMGKQILIVDRDGQTYPPEKWDQSNTFRLGNQSGLILSDNQTGVFANSAPQEREQMSQNAWGSKRPAVHP